jgi:hypothetical protein
VKGLFKRNVVEDRRVVAGAKVRDSKVEGSPDQLAGYLAQGYNSR